MRFTSKSAGSEGPGALGVFWVGRDRPWEIRGGGPMSTLRFTPAWGVTLRLLGDVGIDRPL